MTEDIDWANESSEPNQAIISGAKTLEETPVWITENKGYNYIPKPFEEMDLQEALHEIIVSPSVTTYHQVYQDELPDKDFRGKLCNTKVFWFNSYAIALAGNYDEEITAYRVGCKHKNTTEEKIGRHQHKVTCNNCGYKYKYDSS